MGETLAEKYSRLLLLLRNQHIMVSEVVEKEARGFVCNLEPRMRFTDLENDDFCSLSELLKETSVSE